MGLTWNLALAKVEHIINCQATKSRMLLISGHPYVSPQHQSCDQPIARKLVTLI